MPSSTDTTTTGRWKASTSFDATMPMTPRCQPSPDDDEHRAGADVRVALDRLAGRGEDLLLLVLPSLVLLVELRRQRPRLVGHGGVGGEQEARGDVGRGHAAGRVHARREHEADVVAVDRLAGSGPRRRAAPAAPPCAGRARAARGRSCAMTRFSPTSGTTSASVPMAAILTNAGSHFSWPVRAQSACTSLSATPTPARFLSGYAQSRLLRVDDGQRRRQLVLGLVVVGDDQVDAELARAPRGVHAADAAVHRDDQAHAVGVQPLDGRHLQPVPVAQAARGGSARRCRRATRSPGAG